MLARERPTPARPLIQTRHWALGVVTLAKPGTLGALRATTALAGLEPEADPMPRPGRLRFLAPTRPRAHRRLRRLCLAGRPYPRSGLGWMLRQGAPRRKSERPCTRPRQPPPRTRHQPTRRRESSSSWHLPRQQGLYRSKPYPFSSLSDTRRGQRTTPVTRSEQPGRLALLPPSTWKEEGQARSSPWATNPR
jgi:hypothetical protein